MLNDFYKSFLKLAGLCPLADLRVERERSKRAFDGSVRFAQEVLDADKAKEQAIDRALELEAEVQRLKADNDRLTQDLMLAARTESMAVERAWHAVELVKLLRVKLDLQHPPRGVICQGCDE